MTLMETILCSDLDLSPLGFRKDTTGKMLPEGARLITGANGGRFLCIKGQRDAVFFEGAKRTEKAVRCSRSFRSFLAILLAAGDLTAVIMALSAENRECWENYRKRHPKSTVQKEVLKQLRLLSGVKPALDVYGEISAVKQTYLFSLERDDNRKYETIPLTEIVF